MGIKGIYGEIGPGKRISLAKLAIEKYEQCGRPMRMAIDISIWQFQIQSGKGGSNPTLRTLYYRLLRLLSLSIQPLFVFDGPNRPLFKRNKKVDPNGGSQINFLTKQMLGLFGFPFHDAPGEAEAECALLQREGIVDAVLSEDVDTLMFGCGLTFRNWSSEESRGHHSPTHVSVYDAEATRQGKSGLDRHGMVLVALMSGGDYIPEGLVGCGIKVACEAARAGFGKSLCRLSRTDSAGFEAWREKLSHEIQTNESKHFRTRHMALKIPDNFPDKEALSYYTHPTVSSTAKLEKLKGELKWDREIDVHRLRQFVAENFSWTNKKGAQKFIRGLAPVLLVTKLMARGNRRASGFGDIVLTAMNEMELVREICGKRTNFSTDGLPELRLVYHPLDIVKINMDDELDIDIGVQDDLENTNNDENEDHNHSDDDPGSRDRPKSPSKRGSFTYDPTAPDRVWVLETITKIGIPLKVEDYEESLRDPKKFITAKYAAKKAMSKGGMPRGALDRYFTITKPVADMHAKAASPSKIQMSTQSPPHIFHSSTKSSETKISKPESALPRPRGERHKLVPDTKPTSKKLTKPKAIQSTVSSHSTSEATNPWSLSQTSSSNNTKTPPVRSSKAGVRTGNVEKSATNLNDPYPQLCQTNNNELSTSLSGSLTKHPRPRTPSPTSDGNNVIASPSPTKRRPLTSANQSVLQNAIVDQAKLTYEPLSEIQSARIEILGALTAQDNEMIPLYRHMVSPKKPTSYSVKESDVPLKDLSGRVTLRILETQSGNEDGPVNLENVGSTAQMHRIDDSKNLGMKKSGTRYLMPRKSMAGAWKEIGEDERDIDPEGGQENAKSRGRAWRMSEVDVLDLTND